VKVPCSLGKTRMLAPDKCFPYKHGRRNIKGELKMKRREFIDNCDAWEL